jgi:hypothetical protein
LKQADIAVPWVDADTIVYTDNIFRLSLKHLKKVTVRMHQHACDVGRIIAEPRLLQ